MLECFKFLLNCVIQLITVLFNIDVGFTNLGVVMCIVYILLPMLLVIVNFFKTSFMEELNDRYDESRPRETWSFTEHQYYNPTSGKASRSYNSNHTTARSRRYKL